MHSYLSEMLKFKYVQYIFKKNNNLIIKYFIPMYSRENVTHCSNVSFICSSRQILPSREIALRKIEPYQKG